MLWTGLSPTHERNVLQPWKWQRYFFKVLQQELICGRTGSLPFATIAALMAQNTHLGLYGTYHEFFNALSEHKTAMVTYRGWQDTSFEIIRPQEAVDKRTLSRIKFTNNHHQKDIINRTNRVAYNV